MEKCELTRELREKIKTDAHLARMENRWEPGIANVSTPNEMKDWLSRTIDKTKDPTCNLRLVLMENPLKHIEEGEPYLTMAVTGHSQYAEFRARHIANMDPDTTLTLIGELEDLEEKYNKCKEQLKEAKKRHHEDLEKYEKRVEDLEKIKPNDSLTINGINLRGLGCGGKRCFECDGYLKELENDKDTCSNHQIRGIYKQGLNVMEKN